MKRTRPWEVSDALWERVQPLLCFRLCDRVRVTQLQLAA